MIATSGKLATDRKKQLEECRKWNEQHPFVGGLTGEINLRFLLRLLTDPREYRRVSTGLRKPKSPPR